MNIGAPIQDTRGEPEGGADLSELIDELAACRSFFDSVLETEAAWAKLHNAFCAGTAQQAIEEMVRDAVYAEYERREATHDGEVPISCDMINYWSKP